MTPTPDLLGEPGRLLATSADPVRPQPTVPPGDRAEGWLKVGAQGLGGTEFDYGNGYFGADGPAPWKQT